VVCATCAGAGDDERLHTARFKMVIIDEATQSTEPSTIIPLVRRPSPLQALTGFLYPEGFLRFNMVTIEEAAQSTKPCTTIPLVRRPSLLHA
jgi:superfamily I DNA and/or RNA helicase